MRALGALVLSSVMVIGLAGCSSEPSEACKQALQYSDTLLVAAAEGMVANKQLLSAIEAGDYSSGTKALDTIEKSNRTVDEYGEKYKTARDECLKEKS